MTGWINIRISDDDKAKLERVAMANERTLAAEIRVAIRQYLKSGKVKA